MAVYPAGRSFVQAAVDAVLKAGLRPVDMAQFAAREDTPAEYCQQRVRECDLYLAVVGFRYGSRVPDRDDDVSYTELEFLTATQVGMPRLVFVLDDEVAVPRSLVDKDSTAADGFRERLRDANVIVKAFASPVDLGEAVLHALYEERLNRIGRGGGVVSRVDAGAPADTRRPWMAPPLDRVVDRRELAAPLVAALTAPGPADVGLTTALEGAGGFGKTTLATWVCHRPEVDHRYPGGLLWVTVGQEVHGADLAERVNDLTFILSGSRPAISDPEAAGAELGRLLDERDPVLLVVDDVWASSQLRPFRFGGRACTRLVTTRIPDVLPGDGPRILVDVMSARQARELVGYGVSGLPAGVVDRLATVAGRWPVLLNLVNGALRRRVARGQSPERAAAEIQQTLAARGPAALDPARPGDRTQAVAATVAASLTLLHEEDRHRYLDLAIFPEDVDIPLDVLALLWPDGRVEAVCEEFAGLGLVADVRLDQPGPRLVVHDVLRAYLRSQRGAGARAEVHRRLVDAAAGLLPAHGDDGPQQWWRLPDGAGYLWRFLPHHLHEASRSEELAALTCDLRWVEAKTRQFGSAVGVEADLALVDTPTAMVLASALRQAAHLLGPIHPPDALGATLASRLHGLRGLEAVLGHYRATLPRPRLEPAWPLPDQHDPAQLSATVGHTGSLTSCASSPDGTLLATVGDDCTARLWRIPDGTPSAVLTGHTGCVWDCAFSPDGTVLATVGDDRTARLWRIPDGTPLAVLVGHTDGVTGCAFSPDGALLATASSDGTARLWLIADGTPRGMLNGHTGGVGACAFSPDGALLATASSDGTARLWQIPDGSPLGMLTGHTDGVTGCAFSPDGALIATVGDGGGVRLWHTPDRTLAAVLAGHDERVERCAFSPDGTLLATTAHDGTARLWWTPDGTPHATLHSHTNWVRGCAFSPDGTLLATCGDERVVRLWQVSDGTPQTVLGGYSGNVGSCAFSPDGTLLAATSSEPVLTTAGVGTVRLWKVPGGAEPAVTLHADVAGRCAFSSDGTLLATGSREGTVHLWRMPDGTQRADLTGHTARIRHCSFSPDGTLLATASNDRTVRIWQMPDGTEHTVLTGHAGRVTSCQFSPDGALLATAGSGGMLLLWRIPDGRLMTRLTGHTDWVNSCAFSPDGTLLATASDDRTVRLWHLPDGTPQAVLTGHISWVERCAFSPDGALLATTSRDGTVRLWHVMTGACHCAIRVAGPLLGVAWHPSGTMLCTTGGAGTYMFAYLP